MSKITRCNYSDAIMRREEYFAEQFQASRHMILVTPTNRKADKNSTVIELMNQIKM